MERQLEQMGIGHVQPKRVPKSQEQRQLGALRQVILSIPTSRPWVGNPNGVFQDHSTAEIIGHESTCRQRTRHPPAARTACRGCRMGNDSARPRPLERRPGETAEFPVPSHARRRPSFQALPSEQAKRRIRSSRESMCVIGSRKASYAIRRTMHGLPHPFLPSLLLYKLKSAGSVT